MVLAIECFWIECRKTETKESQRPIRRKENTFGRTEAKNRPIIQKRGKTRETKS